MSELAWMSEPASGGNKKQIAGAVVAASVASDTADRTAMISAKLKSIYRKAVRPLEKRYRYDYFFESPLLTDVEFDAKPQVLLVGQYSVGKTSFIRYLLGRDFPGQRIGPAPTTDRFTGTLIFLWF